MNPIFPDPNTPNPDVPPGEPKAADPTPPPSEPAAPPAGEPAAKPEPAPATGAPAGADGGEEYEPVAGLDRQTVELKRAYEAEVERKVSNDHVHIVLAYGVIWALFVVYGVTLWLRHRRLERDLAELRRARGETR